MLKWLDSICGGDAHIESLLVINKSSPATIHFYFYCV